MKKPRKPLSELQKANLLTGICLRKCYNTECLIRFLTENGYGSSAMAVKNALQLGRKIAFELGKEAIIAAKEKKDV